MANELDSAMKNVEDGEVTEEDKEVIKDAADKVKVEADLTKTVQQKLDDLGLDPESDLKDDDEEENEEDEKEKDDKDGKDEDDDKDTEVDDKNKDDTTSEDGKKTDDDTLTLPAPYMQTAVRLGMSEEKVKEDFDKNPEAMISLLGELHKGENGLSARYAQMGRAIQEKQVAAQKNTDDDVDDSSSKSFVDIKKLKAQYEDDGEETALIDGVIKPLNDALVKMNKDIQQLRVQPNDQNRYSQQEDLAVKSEIENYFENDQLKEFKDYYGSVKPGEDPRVVLNGAQLKHRFEVCNEANLIRMGADFAGEKLVLSDVLQRAHLQLTEPLRAEMIREELTAKIKKRGKGISVKAGTKRVPDKSSEKDPGKRLEADTAKRLKALNW